MMAPYSASNNANAAGMASAHGPPVSHTPDGAAQALEAQTKAYQGRYAKPIGGDNYAEVDATKKTALQSANLPSNYNLAPAPPVKYTQDSAAKEHFRDKETIIAGINSAEGTDAQVQRVVQVGEAEVELMREARRTAELANFDRYVYSLVDPRQPGSLKWLNEVYPEFVSRRIEQVQTDYGTLCARSNHEERDARQLKHPKPDPTQNSRYAINSSISGVSTTFQVKSSFKTVDSHPQIPELHPITLTRSQIQVHGRSGHHHGTNTDRACGDGSEVHAGLPGAVEV